LANQAAGLVISLVLAITTPCCCIIPMYHDTSINLGDEHFLLIYFLPLIHGPATTAAADDALTASSRGHYPFSTPLSLSLSLSHACHPLDASFRNITSLIPTNDSSSHISSVAEAWCQCEQLINLTVTQNGSKSFPFLHAKPSALHP
jgi:hypothetical protein